MAVPPVIEWRDGAVRILDQRRLPDAIEVLHCTEVAQVMEAIRTLAIRGAPALGVAGAYGVALGAHSYNAETDGPFAGNLDRAGRRHRWDASHGGEPGLGRPRGPRGGGAAR